ncbi:hypothetical protein NOVOSPHI9U_420300 [Novosphingobium sp. 9U]|nr:hypothetical protein NOVOSPHI9U_420300 [Novosphingobium sp. 9U]
MARPHERRCHCTGALGEEPVLARNIFADPQNGHFFATPSGN